VCRHLGPIELVCDAPPYAVVHACERVGLLTPFDVRWCRLGSRPEGSEAGSGLHPLRWLFDASPTAKTTCICGEPLPPVDRYAFTFASGAVQHYLLGQCLRCFTIIWEEGHERGNLGHNGRLL
jgi:hypothetical protein